MTIDECVMEFLKLGPGAKTGINAETPVEIVTAVKQATVEFLKENPYLEKDPGYIEFLKKYSGCFFFRKQDGFAIDVFGYGPRRTQFFEGNDRIDVEPGFMLFALVFRRQSFNMQIDYGFDMTGNRKPGVYAHYCFSGETEFEWEYPSFTDWFENLLELREGII